MRKTTRTLIALAMLAPFLQAPWAQETSAYREPPQVMRDLLLAPPTPTVRIDGKAEWMLILGRGSYPSLAELAAPEVRVAGLRMNPLNFSPSRIPTVERITLHNISQGRDHPLKGMPAPLRATGIQWNPSETRFGFVQLGERRADLYVVDIATKTARKVNTAALNTLPSFSFAWLGDDRLVYRTVPTGKAAMPQRPAVPDGPVIQENLGRQGASRTYQDLIRTPYDERLFEWLTTAQLVVNDMKSEKPVGRPAIHSGISVSPDRTSLLLTAVVKPFSYLIPYSGFPKRVSVVDVASLREHLVAETPSEEGAPIGFDDVPDFPRNFEWRSDVPATVVYVQALDRGMGRSPAAQRDAAMAVDMKGDRKPRELFRTRRRLSDIVWGDGEHAVVYERMFSDRRIRMSLFNPSNGRMDSLFERSSNDAYGDIGTPLTHPNRYGKPALILWNGRNLLLRAQGASPEGDRPLLQSLDLATGARTLLWRCDDTHYETVVDMVDPQRLLVLTSRERARESPNYFLRDLRMRADIPRQVTAFPDPYPQLEGISRQKVSYKRSDGIDLTGDLYLPKGYDAAKQGPLPVLLWAYPREYKSASDAAQVRGSRHSFTRLGWGSPIYWATQGYAVLDNAEMPIVGEGDTEPNDRFIPQLYMNAKAAIDHLSRMGVGDSTRVGVGGHSYGAFMTANLLAHTKLFRAGIARSGAYNRTLTPFGFQAEERTYWQAPEVYRSMSPFSFADRIRTPLLLIHGELDNNTGTFPIQSERFYNALKGHGATVRYVQLPFESHGYAARENLLHLLWEQHQWLERHVKQPEGAHR